MGEGETRRRGHTLEAGLEQLELGPALSDVDHFTELRLAHLGLAALIDEPPPPVLPEREEGLDPALAPVLAGEDPEPALERPRSSRRNVRELKEGREAREGGLGEEGVQSHDARAREQPVVGKRDGQERGQERRQPGEERAELCNARPRGGGGARGLVSWDPWLRRGRRRRGRRWTRRTLARTGLVPLDAQEVAPDEHADLPRAGTLKRPSHHLEPAVLAALSKAELARFGLEDLLAPAELGLGLLLDLGRVRPGQLGSRRREFRGRGKERDEVGIRGVFVEPAEEGRRGRVEDAFLCVAARAEPPLALRASQTRSIGMGGVSGVGKRAGWSKVEGGRTTNQGMSPPKTRP
jgi:hypothetical protein